MSALLKPLVESEVTDYVTGGEGGNILSQCLGGGGGLDGPLVTELKFTHSKDFVSYIWFKNACFILRSSKAFKRRIVSLLSIRSTFSVGGKLGLRGRSNRTAHEAFLQTPGQ